MPCRLLFITSQHLPEDIGALEQADGVIHQFRMFWRQKRFTDYEKWKHLPQLALVLLGQ